MSLIRSETDARISLYRATEVSTVATQAAIINAAGVGNASLYIANLCTAAVAYIIKGSYSRNETTTSYWYPITSGTAGVGTITCIGAFGGAGAVSALANPNNALMVEIVATAATTGILVMQLQAW